MTAQILDGKRLAATIQDEVRDRVAEFIEHTGITPCLAAVLVGEDPASQVYVSSKQKACDRAGIESRLHRLPETTSEDELLGLVSQLNGDAAVHGILVQLPLPVSIRAERVLDAVHPAKDVDAFHAENVGRIVQGRPRFLPCTPHGVLQILHRSGITTAGKHVVIVGRSDIVGKPLALMLAQRNSHLGPSLANATVTLCHTQTQELAQFTRQADILIAAVGRPRLITADMVRPGATVIDVGINREASGIVGDVDFEDVAKRAAHITPVPGGVGRLTVAMLLENTLRAAELQTAGP